MTNHQIGLLIMAAGILAVLIGALIWAGGLTWFGNLPGDIRVERENVRFYVPLTSMLLVSIVLTLILFAVRRVL